MNYRWNQSYWGSKAANKQLEEPLVENVTQKIPKNANWREKLRQTEKKADWYVHNQQCFVLQYAYSQTDIRAMMVMKLCPSALEFLLIPKRMT